MLAGRADRTSLWDAGQNPLRPVVEFAGRQCYRSRVTKGRGIEAYIDNILTQGHGSVLEHATVNLAVAGVSRSLSHELVRHRSGWAYSQESQRYVEARDVRLVVPPAIIDADLVLWWAKLQEPALEAFALTADKLVEVGLNRKQALEAARSALPNAAETRLLGTVNIRALRHFLELRGSTGADREIRRFANAVLAAVLTTWEHPPLVLNDLASTGADGTIHSKYRKV